MAPPPHKGFESPLEPTAQFFVDSMTPRNNAAPRRHHRDDGKGDMPVTAAIMLESGPRDGGQDRDAPRIDIQVLTWRLLLLVLATVLFVGGFSVVFYVGIVVDTVYEKIGTSKESEERVEKYNTISGYVMAIIEVLVGMHVDRFHPVFDVYVHNALYFLMREDGSPGARRARRTLHSAILFIFPIFLVLFMGNSLRGLQASQSSVGFKHIMRADDLHKEQPMLDVIKDSARNKTKNGTLSVRTADSFAARGVEDIILKNAIRARSNPFTFLTKSPCGDDDRNGNSSVDIVPATAKTARTIKLNVHDIDSTSVAYGFEPQEWNSEALDKELEPTYSYDLSYDDIFGKKRNKSKPAPPTNFSLATAFDIFMQGKILVEKAYADSTRETYPCQFTDGLFELDVNTTNANATSTPPSSAASGNGTSRPHHRRSRRRLEGTESGDDGDGWIEYDPDDDDGANQWVRVNGIRMCEGAASSIYNFAAYDDPSMHTIDNFMTMVTEELNVTFGNAFALEETEVHFRKFDVTPQVQVEAMVIDLKMHPDINYGLLASCAGEPKDSECHHMYTYTDSVGESFCGSTGCAFLDKSKTFNLQREIGLIPYMTNCSLSKKDVKYSADFRGFYPTNCKKHENTALIYGIGSYISGREYGSNDTDFETGDPYIKRPRRHVRFTFAKMSWQVGDLAKLFQAKCNVGKEDAGDCGGLWYKLQPSGRYLFVGKDALPTKKIMRADFRAPVPLVQLNSPTLFVPELNESITLERLNPTYFNVTKWDAKKNQTLRGDACSMIVDSYLSHIESNNFFLERPLQAMYTSAFYYLMGNAAVTPVNDIKLANVSANSTANGTKNTIQLSKSQDLLGNVKLSGDVQVRNIRVQIPLSSFLTTVGGCVVIFVLMLLILFFPTQRVEHFEEGTTKAQQYIALASDETYPDIVHHKTLLFPATTEIVPTEELAVERLTLVHEKDEGRMVHL